MKKFLKHILLIGFCCLSLYLAINILELSNTSSDNLTTVQQEIFSKNPTTKNFLIAFDERIPFDANLQETDTTSCNIAIRLLRNKNLTIINTLFTRNKNNFYSFKSFFHPYNNSINRYYRPIILYYIFDLRKIII